MFGKYEVVEWLLNEEDFDVIFRIFIINEIVLYLVVCYFYKVLLVCELRLENMIVIVKVVNFEKVVVFFVRKEVSFFWVKDGLNREIVFYIFGNCLVKVIFLNNDLKEEDWCLVFYLKSIIVMFKFLLVVKCLIIRDIVKVLSVRNGDGDSFLYIIVRVGVYGYKLFKYLVKFLGFVDIMKVKNSKYRIVLDIVNECYFGYEKELFVIEEGEVVIFRGVGN